MVASASKNGELPKKRGVGARGRRESLLSASAVMEKARRAGLLDGDWEHIRFRAPKALIEAAKHASGATDPAELGLLGLAMLAQPDPAARYMKRGRGKLRVDHELDY